MRENILPNKLSKLLTVAMIDLELVEQDSRYKIDMGEWHTPSGSKCEVCFAGSVMAQTLKIPEWVYVDSPDELPARSDTNNVSLKLKLEAINSLRSGDLIAAFEYLAIDTTALKFLTPDPIEYDSGKVSNEPGLYSLEELKLISNLADKRNRDEWKAHMYDLIGILEAEGQ